MLHEVAGLLAAYNTTVLLVGEYRHEDIATFPEFAVADGIIELARNALGTRDERYLRVFKLRGSSYRPGFHAFDITAAGLQVVSASRQPSRGGLLQAGRWPYFVGRARARFHARGRLLDRERNAARRSHRVRKDDDGHSIHHRGTPSGRTVPVWSISRRIPRSSHTRSRRSAEGSTTTPAVDWSCSTFRRWSFPSTGSSSAFSERFTGDRSAGW